jgi:hypothetical protein
VIAAFNAAPSRKATKLNALLEGAIVGDAHASWLSLQLSRCFAMHGWICVFVQCHHPRMDAAWHSAASCLRLIG